MMRAKLNREPLRFGKAYRAVCHLRRGCLDVGGLHFELNMAAQVSPGPNNVLLTANDEFNIIQAAASFM